MASISGKEHTSLGSILSEHDTCIDTTLCTIIHIAGYSVLACLWDVIAVNYVDLDYGLGVLNTFHTMALLIND